MPVQQDQQKSKAEAERARSWFSWQIGLRSKTAHRFITLTFYPSDAGLALSSGGAGPTEYSSVNLSLSFSLLRRSTVIKFRAWCLCNNREAKEASERSKDLDSLLRTAVSLRSAVGTKPQFLPSGSPVAFPISFSPFRYNYRRLPGLVCPYSFVRPLRSARTTLSFQPTTNLGVVAVPAPATGGATFWRNTEEMREGDVL